MKYKNIPPQIAAKLNESVGRVRRILLVRGTCATLAVFVASVLAIMAVDAMVTIYAAWIRWALWAAGVAGTCAVGYFALVKPLSRRFTAAEIASLIERNHPELEERLSTVVELAEAGDIGSSSRLMAEITKDAIKDAGFSAIQLSPMQPQKDYGSGRIKDQWWKLYQPLGFKVADDTHKSVIGTKNQLISLASKARAKGLKIVMDIVANHLANNGGDDQKWVLQGAVKDVEPQIYKVVGQLLKTDENAAVDNDWRCQFVSMEFVQSFKFRA